MKTKDPIKQLRSENEVLKNDIKYLQAQLSKKDMEFRGLLLVTKSLKPTAEVKKNALKILVAMIQSQPPHNIDRHNADVKKWARKAYEFANALESEGSKP